VESGGFGHVGWYSKDVMTHPYGHVECIIIAKDRVIAQKRAALQEVIEYIHQAGRDIELARQHGGAPLEAIVAMIRKHIPAHGREAIIQSLRSDLNVINYQNLNVDENAKASFREIMELAFEAGFIQQKIDIEQLADESFATQTTINLN
jgi:NitT/TauT family transport system substrate-binding protein